MKKTIITIGREHGSGGVEIAKRLADALGYKFYDKELITEIADKTMVSADFIKGSDENVQKRNIFQEVFPIFASDQASTEQYIFNEQGKFIKELAKKGNCVIIGRRADYYLKDEPEAFHLFFYADPEFRAKRISERYNVSLEEAKVRIDQMDRKRKASYEYTTGRKWGEYKNYDRMICTSTFGIDKTVEELVELLK